MAVPTSAGIPTPAAMPTPHLPGAESTLDPWRGLTASPTTQGEPCRPSCWWDTLNSHSRSVGYSANTSNPSFPFSPPQSPGHTQYPQWVPAAELAELGVMLVVPTLKEVRSRQGQLGTMQGAAGISCYLMSQYERGLPVL